MAGGIGHVSGLRDAGMSRAGRIGLLAAPLILAFVLWRDPPAGLDVPARHGLPVGTPPNAIVFASGLVPLPRMVRAGLLVNALFALLIPVAVLTLGVWAFGITAVAAR